MQTKRVAIGRIVLLLLMAVDFSVAQVQWHFPLKPGTVWEYWRNGSVAGLQPWYAWTSRVLGDTTLPNGRTYAVLSRTVTGYSNSPQWLRQDGAILYEFLPGAGDEVMAFNLSKAKGDTIITRYYQWDSSLVTCDDSVRTTDLGKVWTTKVFGEKRFNSVESIYWYVTDSLGISKLGFIPDQMDYFLHGAIADGIQYGTITSVNAHDRVVPGEIILDQNYPNPFNPYTKVEFHIPQSGMVTLAVFDLLGRHVGTLIDRDMDAGTHAAVWDGRAYPSGVYIIRLQHSDQVRTRAIVLLK